MANSIKETGKEAQTKWGWWYAHRFLFWRRLVQLSILACFLSGPWLGIWILKGNYSGSTLLDTVPLVDPLMLAQSLSTGYLPNKTALLGVLIVVGFYGVVGSRVFCAWCCPLNIITDISAWLRRQLGIRQTLKIPKNLRYVLLAVILVGSAISGTMLWEWVNPVATFSRGIIYGFGASLWLIIAVFLFDIFIASHGWCGHICPIGACYGVIGVKGVIRIKVVNKPRCDHCMDCYNVCPEPQVIRSPLHGKNEQSAFILSKDCISCGRCIDVCAEKVFKFSTKLNDSGE